MPSSASAGWGIFYLIEMLVKQAHETVFTAAEVLKVGGSLCSWLMVRQLVAGFSIVSFCGNRLAVAFFTSLQYRCNKLMRHSFGLLKLDVSSYFIIKLVSRGAGLGFSCPSSASAGEGFLFLRLALLSLNYRCGRASPLSVGFFR